MDKTEYIREKLSSFSKRDVIISDHTRIWIIQRQSDITEIIGIVEKVGFS